MPHPVFGPPVHVLESVQLTLTLPTLRNGSRTTLSVTGETSTKRMNVWRYSESWSHEEAQGALTPCDVAYWVLLAVAQDRPSSPAELERVLLPGGWQDVPLPLA